jgi:hypothetical protein
MSASISKKARAPSFWDWDGVARSPVGSGLLDIKGVEQCLETLKRRGTSRPSVVVISYAGNDISGTHGFIHCEWLNQEMACYSQRWREVANSMLEERVNTHFAALNDFVKLSAKPDVGNIVLVMPWFGRLRVASRLRSPDDQGGGIAQETWPLRPRRNLAHQVYKQI